MTKKIVNLYNNNNTSELSTVCYVNGVRYEIKNGEDVEVPENVKEVLDYAKKAEKKFDYVPKGGNITPKDNVTPRVY